MNDPALEYSILEKQGMKAGKGSSSPENPLGRREPGALPGQKSYSELWKHLSEAELYSDKNAAESEKAYSFV